MTTATTRLLDALRAAQGNCTDYRVSKLLNLDTAAVSKWRVGKGHMSIATIARVCELAGIPDQTWDWQIRIGAERELGPDGDLFRDALKDLERVRAGAEPAPGGLLAWARNGGRAAAIMAFALLAGGVLFPAKEALAASVTAGPAACHLYILLNRLWRHRRRRLWGFTWFPIADLSTTVAVPA